jgi:hypothetical protein
MDSARVESLSRQTVHMWTGRDAPHLGELQHTHNTNSLRSGYARTVVNNAIAPSLSPAVVNGETVNHHIVCDNCERVIVGTRFQCANCPSSPTSYNLVCFNTARLQTSIDTYRQIVSAHPVNQSHT